MPWVWVARRCSFTKVLDIRTKCVTSGSSVIVRQNTHLCVTSENIIRNSNTWEMYGWCWADSGPILAHEVGRSPTINPLPADHVNSRFCPSACWARRGIVVPFARRLLRRRRRTHSFGYYTNMVQQIKFIIHTNIQPLPALFFTQGQGQRSRSKIKTKKI